MRFEPGEIYENVATHIVIKIDTSNYDKELKTWELVVEQLDPVTLEFMCHNFMGIPDNLAHNWEIVEIV